MYPLLLYSLLKCGKALPLGELARERLRGQALHDRAAAQRSKAAFVRAMLSLRLCLSASDLALSVTLGDTSPKGRGFCSRAGRSLKIKRVLPKYTAM
ncbi:MAG: hypothetical protein BHW28_06210 [Faecalibacterium prausnitzii]|nr:MAG: hypothetical protein BHW28_06210 [Faecalibacterium prausnitzii]